MKKAIIIGISGQDGAYLARLLFSKGYEVYGTSRDADLTSFENLKKLNIINKVKLFSMSLVDFRSVMQIILQIQPDEVYNLAGQTSVGLSFLHPFETLESISVGTLNILEILRYHKLQTKFYNASSSECFGETDSSPANENTPFRPRSPYAVAKAAAFWQVANYREAYNLFACSGILFNHDSPLRPKRFVTKKIIDAVCKIAKGNPEKLVLGNISVSRDWGWAPEYVNAMYLILQQEKPDDFVVATGKTISLKDFVEKAFSYFNLDFRDYLIYDNDLLRPSDILYSSGNASKAEKILGWKADTLVDDVIIKMIESEMNDTHSSF
ncbi:MAG TPA: GDP-mannose 4,6-dehydratase [Bacteroidales bacterium]|nr:GDP-mannose 4,6-dehydratase [Bacteroidales bacterium]